MLQLEDNFERPGTNLVDPTEFVSTVRLVGLKQTLIDQGFEQMIIDIGPSIYDVIAGLETSTPAPSSLKAMMNGFFPLTPGRYAWAFANATAWKLTALVRIRLLELRGSPSPQFLDLVDLNIQLSSPNGPLRQYVKSALLCKFGER